MDADGKFLALKVNLIANLGRISRSMARSSLSAPPCRPASMTSGPRREISKCLHQHLSGRCLSRRRATEAAFLLGWSTRVPARWAAPTKSATATSSSRRSSGAHADRPPLRRRRVRRPRDAGDAARGGPSSTRLAQSGFGKIRGIGWRPTSGLRLRRLGPAHVEAERRRHGDAESAPDQRAGSRNRLCPDDLRQARPPIDKITMRQGTPTI